MSEKQAEGQRGGTEHVDSLTFYFRSCRGRSLIYGRVQQKGEAGVGCQRDGAPTDGWDGLVVQAEREGGL